MSNFEKVKEEIKNMSMEEFAKFIDEICNGCKYCAFNEKSCENIACKDGIKQYFESEVQEDDRIR